MGVEYKRIFPTISLPHKPKKIKWNRCFQLRFQLDLLLLLLHLLLIIIYYSHYYSGIELQQREEINGQKQDMHTWWTCVMDFQIFWCRRTWIAKDGTGRIDRTFRLTRTSAIETTSNGIWLVNGFNLVWLCNLVLLYIQSINKSIRINTEWSFFFINKWLQICRLYFGVATFFQSNYWYTTHKGSKVFSFSLSFVFDSYLVARFVSIGSKNFVR